MSMTTEGFRDVANQVKSLAGRLCGGRVVASLEGGYSLDHLPPCNLAVVDALAGLAPSLESYPLELDVPTRLTDDVKNAAASARRAAGP